MDIDPNNAFTIHEALHTTSLVVDLWDREIVEHPALSNKPEIKALAERACEAMAEVYQAIGGIGARGAVTE